MKEGLVGYRCRVAARAQTAYRSNERVCDERIDAVYVIKHGKAGNGMGIDRSVGRLWGLVRYCSRILRLAGIIIIIMPVRVSTRVCV